MLGLLGVLMLAAISNAPVEFCPAAITIRAQRVKHSYQDQLPRSAQYGFELSAEGSRVVTSSKVAFETDAGWFTIDVPPVALTERFWHYGRPYDRVIDREFVSPVMYTKFPAPVRVLRVWVSSAAASGDNTFGWSGKGTVQCEPPPVRDVHAFDPSMDVVDFDDLGAEPPAGALQLTPQSSPALASANCRNPFEDIKSIERLLPDGTANTNHSRDAKDVLLRAAIDASGHVVSAWIVSSSGYADYDKAALGAPLRGAFQPGRAYCHNVPGTLSMIFDMRGIYNYEHAPGFPR